MAKQPGKTESLTIRLDPKIRFQLEFVARLRGQTITTVVERAIAEVADREKFIDPDNPGQAYEQNWRDVWSVSEGVRALRMARVREIFPRYEEERRLAFCQEHWPFFYMTGRKQEFKTYYVDVLWPRIDEFIAIHDQTKTKDYFAAGKAMQAALEEANLRAPEWPSKTAKPDFGKPSSRDLDDDIPF